MTDAFRAARWLALVLPAALVGGALASQYAGGLYPCEMCHWQRWPHYAAIPIAALAFVVPHAGLRRLLVGIAAAAIAASGAIAVFHAGVEYGWWEGVTACTAPVPTGGDFLEQLVRRPIVRCDVAQWTLGGVSLAGFNALFSLGGAIAIWVLLARETRA